MILRDSRRWRRTCSCEPGRACAAKSITRYCANALRLLAERRVRPRDKPRVIFLGGFCEQPPLEMIETIEDACFIVDDDLLIGQRWITEDIAGG